jgi:Cu/Zn superoxide dismutase
MRMSALVLTAATAVVLAVPATAASPTNFSATLNGKSEVPKSASKATGTATFKIAASGKSIAYTLNAKGLSGKAQAAHIHLGAVGKAGGVMIAIKTKPFSLPAKGTLTAKQFTAVPGASTFSAALKAIRAGKTYANIHTAKYQAGEIRGQIRAAK